MPSTSACGTPDPGPLYGEHVSGGFWWRLIIGWCLAAVVIVFTLNPGGLEGPCSNEASFARSVDQTSTDFRVEHQSWPPGQRCVAVAANGSVVASETYPRPWEWLLAGFAAVSPFLVTWAYRAVRRRRPPAPQAPTPK